MEFEGYDVRPKSGMLSQQLWSRRELVEQLESEPLFDYLVQNGVIDQPIVEQLRSEKSAAKVNISLLRHIEGNGRQSMNLFVNALRQTGQHHIASLVDDGVRIKALSGSGYLSKSRHKGQVSLHIYVKAMKLPESFTCYTVAPSREWLSIEDIKLQIHDLLNPVVEKEKTPSVQQFEIVDDVPEEKKRSCLCGCFSGLFSRQKTKAPKINNSSNKKTTTSTDNNKNDSNGKVNSTTNVENSEKFPPIIPVPGDKYTKLTTKINSNSAADDSSCNHEKENTNSQTETEMGEKEMLPEKEAKTSVENLKNIADTLEQKIDIFYKIMNDPSMDTYFKQLVKYFEQMRGTLVLDAKSENEIVVANICTRVQQVQQLKTDYESENLDEDIENCIITEDILKKVGVEGIKLRTVIDSEELDLVEQELA